MVLVVKQSFIQTYPLSITKESNKQTNKKGVFKHHFTFSKKQTQTS